MEAEHSTAHSCNTSPLFSFFVVFLLYIPSFLFNLASISYAFLASLSFVDCGARGRTMPKRKRTSSIDQPKAPRAAEPRAFSQYTALKKDEQEIRVVTLHAGADRDPISCTIENTLLSQAQPFTALSYCWGSEADFVEIVLNGETVNIRRNLWRFLHSLRHLKGTICIWVDYICIDQNNVVERGHQVQLMADIYRSARGAYAWLGDATHRTDMAIDFANRLSDMPHDWRETPEAKSMRYHGRPGFHSLAERVFWGRIWIIQEVVLAKELDVVVGRRMVEWNRITGTFEKIASSFGTGYKQIFRRIRALREAQVKGNHPTLRKLLHDFRGCKCHDQRDRVYGMLGLVDARTRSQILVDYSHTLIELFVLNSRLLGPRSSKAKRFTVQYPALEIFDSSIFEIVARICGKNGRSVEVSRWTRDQALRHRSDLNLVLDARIRTIRHVFQTFAVKKTIDCDWEPLTIYNQSQDFAAYMTEVRFESSAGIRPPQDRMRDVPYLIVSRVRPEPGDILLHLQPYYCIARRVQGSLQILDIAAIVDQTASKALRNGSVHDWLSAPVPDIKLQLEQSPSVLDYYFTDAIRWPRELHWPVRVNGSALAEGVRLFNDGDRIYNEHTFRVGVTLPWDPTVFVLTSGKCASEPTEAQYDELSRQMRLPADVRPDSLSTQRTLNEWSPFTYGQGYKYHECIPRFETDPLMIPEILRCRR